jgi:hypothetical protein
MFNTNDYLLIIIVIGYLNMIIVNRYDIIRLLIKLLNIKTIYLVN